MKIPALILQPNKRDLVRHEIDPSSPAELIKSTRPPALFLINSKDIERLSSNDLAVHDCGIKKPNKELSKYLLNKKKFPLLRGIYRHHGQMLRSMRVLLQHAQRAHDNNLYFVAIDETLFDELATTISTDSILSRGAAEEGQDVDRWDVLKLMPAEEVPKEIKIRYLGESREVQLVRQLILKAAAQLDAVLILGETGTGKEVVARCIHDASARKGGPFIAVNCAAISPELFESELFGHRKGAFTGAIQDKSGLWDAAQNGTLFFDEIGDLPLSQQAKILRALDQQKILPVGGIEYIPVNARITAATNQDIHAMVASGQFRQDLFYRLNVFVIQTPALRTHPEDIPELAQALWRRIVDPATASLPAEILNEFKRYNWHGNVREMMMVLRVLYSYFGKSKLELNHLYSVYRQGAAPQKEKVQLSSYDHLHYRKDCLAHLIKVDQLLRHFKVTIRPLLEGTSRRKRINLDTIVNLTDNLDLLSIHRLYYGDHELFDAVRHLNGRLRTMTEKLTKNQKQALTYWKDEVEAAYKGVENRLFEVVKTLDEG